jgi:hypothetical protein
MAQSQLHYYILHYYILGGSATVVKMDLTANTIKVGDRCISSTTKLITNSIRGYDGSMKSQGIETLVHVKSRTTLEACLEIALTFGEVRKLVSNCKTWPLRLVLGLGILNVMVQELQFVGHGSHRTAIDVPTLRVTRHCNLLIHSMAVNTHFIELELHVIEGMKCRINVVNAGIEQFHVCQGRILNQTGEAKSRVSKKTWHHPR